MDNVTFLKELGRMCKSYPRCYGCDLFELGCTLGNVAENANKADKIVAIVEQWSKEHPIQTNRQMIYNTISGASKRFCLLHGIFCTNANSNGFCEVTACTKRTDETVTIVCEVPNED